MKDIDKNNKQALTEDDLAFVSGGSVMDRFGDTMHHAAENATNWAADHGAQSQEGLRRISDKNF